MKRIYTFLLVFLTALALASCGRPSDYTEQDRKFLAEEILRMPYGTETACYGIAEPENLSYHVRNANAIFVGTIVRVKDAEWSTSSWPTVTYHYKEYKICVDDLWAGDIVGKTILLKSEDLFNGDELYKDHAGERYIFFVRTEKFGEWKHRLVEGPKSMIPIQPSTGFMYPLWNHGGFEGLEGHAPEYLKEQILAAQQDILENGYDYDGAEITSRYLGDLLQPYQTAHETGNPVEYISPVIRELQKGPLSAYEEEPYYDALLTRVKKAYNSRKSRWGMTEGKLYSILEEMLPKLAEKAERESK